MLCASKAMLAHRHLDLCTTETAASWSVLRTRWFRVLPQPTTTPSLETPGLRRWSTSILVGMQMGLISSVTLIGFAKRTRAIFAERTIRSSSKSLWITICDTSCNTGLWLEEPRVNAPSSTLTNFVGITLGPRCRQWAVVMSHSLSMRVAIQPSISPNTLKWSRAAQGQVGCSFGCHLPGNVLLTRGATPHSDKTDRTRIKWYLDWTWTWTVLLRS